MNKLVAKRLMKEAGIPVAPFTYCYYGDRNTLSFEKLKDQLGLPFHGKVRQSWIISGCIKSEFKR
jgi:D-alanine-D-alanine ligase and related ATP-grasp enzymes